MVFCYDSLSWLTFSYIYFTTGRNQFYIRFNDVVSLNVHTLLHWFFFSMIWFNREKKDALNWGLLRIEIMQRLLEQVIKAEAKFNIYFSFSILSSLNPNLHVCTFSLIQAWKVTYSPFSLSDKLLWSYIYILTLPLECELVGKDQE